MLFDARLASWSRSRALGRGLAPSDANAKFLSLLAKVFIPQQTIDDWLSTDEVEVHGDVLIFQEDGRRLRLVGASRFLRIAGGPAASDSRALVGRVKDEAAMASLGAEVYMDSVLLGDIAYDVASGFMATPIDPRKDGGEPLRATLKTVAFRSHKTVSSSPLSAVRRG